jgi:hypothetical protein
MLHTFTERWRDKDSHENGQNCCLRPNGFHFFFGGGDFETVSTCFPRLAKSSESHIQIIARFYTYIHTYIHTNIHTYIHTFVCVQAQRWKNWDCFEKDSSPLLTTCKCKKFQFTQSGDHNYFIKWGKVMYTVTVLPSPNSWLRDVAQWIQCMHTYLHTYVVLRSLLNDLSHLKQLPWRHDIVVNTYASKVEYRGFESSSGRFHHHTRLGSSNLVLLFGIMYLEKSGNPGFKSRCSKLAFFSCAIRA